MHLASMISPDFRNGIRRPAWPGDETVDRRDVHDAAAPGDQVGQRLVREEERAGEVRPQYCLPVLERLVEQRLVGADAGVVDDDVDASERLAGAFGGGSSPGRVADV